MSSIPLEVIYSPLYVNLRNHEVTEQINSGSFGRVSWKLFLITILIEASLFLTFVTLPTKINIVIWGSLGVLLFYLLVPNPLTTSIVLSVIVATVLPKSFGRALGIKIEEIFPLITGIFLLLEYFKGTLKPRSIGKTGKVLLLFLGVTFISFISGLLKERNTILVLDEFLMILGWGYYLFVIMAGLTYSDQKFIIYALILSSLIVSLFYIFKFVSLHGSVRFRTDQQHIFNVTIPILFAFTLYSDKKLIKILAMFLMIPMILAVYITLTRALWIFIPLALLGQYFFYIKTQKHFKLFTRFLLPIVIIGVLGTFTLWALSHFWGVKTLLGQRIETFKFLEYDPSLMARAELGLYVFKRLRTEFLFGSGLGDFLRYQYFPTLGRFNVYWLDNTYLQLLWKTGIVGLFLFLLFIIYFLNRAKHLMVFGKTAWAKILGTSLFFSFLTLALSSLQCGILIGYRFNFVWATLFALTELCVQTLEDQTHPN
ncbi:MAG: O-antigen ligase family protein [candidate division WOR-3 bacterium]|nr:O-antigen ligase family protein [candidate division WOR-3 bacterium]MCX7757798.1 O-antigen ligase family protein [candidate division WOR-3 bacterium]MDW7987195.1 O-antigen ligase family protein [candidate division WOR-3 bacterium]